MRAQRGKRYRPAVLAFNANLEAELLQLQHELRAFTYRPGPYRQFRIRDPKPRLISAAPYRDRVVHHALCGAIVPPLERHFHKGSHANRLGYGSHRALHRFTAAAAAIACPGTLWLLDQILVNGATFGPALDTFPGDTLLTPLERPRGLPIGNLTSQFLANLHLNDLDHTLSALPGVHVYLRYVDDVVLFADHPEPLQRARACLNQHLEALRLRAHPIKTQLRRCRDGASFVGFVVRPGLLRVRNHNLRSGRRRLKLQHKAVLAGTLSPETARISLLSWNAHLAHGHTWRLRRRLFADLPYASDLP